MLRDVKKQNRPCYLFSSPAAIATHTFNPHEEHLQCPALLATVVLNSLFFKLSVNVGIYSKLSLNLAFGFSEVLAYKLH